jgi:hypothetical protein
MENFVVSNFQLICLNCFLLSGLAPMLHPAPRLVIINIYGFGAIL